MTRRRQRWTAARYRDADFPRAPTMYRRLRYPGGRKARSAFRRLREFYRHERIDAAFVEMFARTPGTYREFSLQRLAWQGLDAYVEGLDRKIPDAIRIETSKLDDTHPKKSP
jgi:hypothetical protein